MSKTVEEILEHKSALEKKKAKKEAAQGVLDSYMEQLKEDHDCNSIEEAQEKLTEMKNNLADSEAKLSQVVSDWQEKYGTLLEN